MLSSHSFTVITYMSMRKGNLLYDSANFTIYLLEKNLRVKQCSYLFLFDQGTCDLFYGGILLFGSTKETISPPDRAILTFGKTLNKKFIRDSDASNELYLKSMFNADRTKAKAISSLK